MDAVDELIRLIPLIWAIAAVAALYVAILVALVIAGRGSLAREVASLLPNLVVLFKGLLADERVPRRAKVALGIGAVYLAMPFDLVPDFIPVAGALDDAVVAALVLRYVLRATDRAVLAAHWRGDPATLERLLRLARA